MKRNKPSIRDLVVVIVFGMFAAWWVISPNTTDSQQAETRGQEDRIETESSLEEERIVVIQIVDGDTIIVEGGETVRYLAIDTPELTHRPPDCYAAEAIERNRELVEGKAVRLEKDVRDTDRYGRLLRYVYVGETQVNRVLVEEGYARAFIVPPDDARREEYIRLETQARESSRGLWGNCDPRLLSVWEQNTPERAETAEYQAENSETPLEDAPACFCEYNFYDCRDFQTADDAQSLYECCAKESGEDIHLIDGDEDGNACEQLYY
ncbi:MAG: thermonuclease family protein [bacterium]|nr:thermonuclease family protein [bacterium]